MPGAGGQKLAAMSGEQLGRQKARSTEEVIRLQVRN